MVSGALLSGLAGANAEFVAPKTTGGGASVSARGPAEENDGGPTILLSYSRETFKDNPISSFMYFVPLISLTLVDRETSADNAQTVRVTSYERKTTAKTFHVTVEFDIRGAGFHRNVFDPNGMIASHTTELKKNEPRTRIVDYIQFSGEGCGRIAVAGTIRNSVETVTEVDV